MEVKLKTCTEIVKSEKVLTIPEKVAVCDMAIAAAPRVERVRASNGERESSVCW